MISSRKRPIPIIRVPATCRVPFGFKPVTAATTPTITARPSQASQFIDVCPLAGDPLQDPRHVEGRTRRSTEGFQSWVLGFRSWPVRAASLDPELRPQYS